MCLFMHKYHNIVITMAEYKPEYQVKWLSSYFILLHQYSFRFLESYVLQNNLVSIYKETFLELLDELC